MTLATVARISELVPRTPLGKNLVGRGLLSAEDVVQGENHARQNGVTLARALRDLQKVSSEDLARALCEIFRCEMMSDLASLEPDREVMAAFGVERCEKYKMAVTADGRVVVADPGAVGEELDELRSMVSGGDGKLHVAPFSDMDDFLRRVSTGNGMPAASLGASQEEKDARPLLDEILAEAVRMGATDVHLEPQDDRSAEIRLRVDGVLRPIKGFRLGRDDWPALVNVILLEARMSPEALESTCQDGALRWDSGNGRSIDVRVSQLPAVHGVSLVLRLLYRDERLENLEDLGYSSEDVEKIRRMSLAPYGLLLVGGPTGSGKSTTLYAVLRMLRHVEKKILTVEDPVEVKVPGVEQVSLGRGQSYAKVVRQFLRHDPDIMLVGEIRDKETAAAAVTAAMTGHLVLSTVHANDGPGTLSRLMDLGLSRRDLATNLVGVISQRLVRVLCPHCRRKASVQKARRTSKELAAKLDALNVKNTWEPGEGCSHCWKGYRGRRVLCEIMPMTSKARAALADGGRIADLIAFTPLAERALEMVATGVTSLAEAQRVVNLLEE